MFRIGEFSKIAQVSGRLLRYYDEIGLLSPEFTDPESGYRYYSANQLPRLNRILVLKELGLSLEQVARLLDRDTSNDELRGMLTLRKAQIERTVQEEMTRFREIESRLKLLDGHSQVQIPDVVLKTVPAQGYLSLREVQPGLSAVRLIVEKMVTTIPNMVGKNNLGNIAIIVHSPIYDSEAMEFEVGYLLTGQTPHTVKLSEERILTTRTLPAIETMATIVHVGSVTESHSSYGALGQWLEANQYQIVGQGREVLMQLPQPDKEAEVVVEIQLPVMKLDQPALFT